MPLYEFRCDRCDEVFEHLLRYSETGLCPLCNQPARRLLSRQTGFVLKGEGWARDGYAPGNKPPGKTAPKDSQE